MSKCECSNNVNIQSGLYCDECIDRRSSAYARWAVKEITDDELNEILDKYQK